MPLTISRPARTLVLLLTGVLLLGAGPQAQAGVRSFEIQGTAHRSPLLGRAVADVPGVVTAVRSNGFYLQDSDGDGNPATSDAVFVFTREAPAAEVGDEVRVAGQVREFRPGGDETGLSATEIGATAVRVVGSGRPLPSPVVLGAGGRAVPARLVAEDASGDAEAFPALRPDASALDFYESLEGMRVQVTDAVVVGRRAGPGELPVLPDDGAGVPGRTVRGGVLAVSPGAAPARIVLADGAVRTPPAGVGDRFPGVTLGVVEYAFGGYRVRLAELPSLVLGGAEPERATPAASPAELLVATFNVENVSARERPQKLARLAETIVQRLGGPDLLALQELQDDSGAADDGTVTGLRTARALTEAIRAAGGPAYEYREIAPENNQDGGEPGGNIRVGLLFRTDRGLTLVERAGGDALTAVVVLADAQSGPSLSIGPGRIEPASPAWLESRKPLAAEFDFNGHRLFVVANHFASKRGDGPPFGRFQPPPRTSEARRVEQARLVHDFVRAVLDADPNANVLVLGDLNDGPGSLTLTALQGDLLVNLLERLPPEERYSYVFDGQSEAVDQILVSPALLAASASVDVVHGNAEIVGAPSDHDPVLARFTLPPR